MKHKLERLFLTGIAAVISCLIVSPLVSASSPQAVEYDASQQTFAAPVVISGYGTQDGALAYAQLFNTSHELINLDSWQIVYSFENDDLSGEGSVSDSRAVTIGQATQLEPGNYMLLTGAYQSGSGEQRYFIDQADMSYPTEHLDGVSLTQISLLPPSGSQYKSAEITIKSGESARWQRNISESTGNMLSSFSRYSWDDASQPLYGGGLYAGPPSDPGLQISSILAHSNDCAPGSGSLDCFDHVKLYNPTGHDVDLSQFRLRTGYVDQAATAANTYGPLGTVTAGGYITLAADADGRFLSLKDSGSYIWLEDKYGLSGVYEKSLLKYPSAGGEHKQGISWAYDEKTDSFQWTDVISPDGPNQFPKMKGSELIGYAACEDGHYRSPETNRCRKSVVKSTSQLKPCATDQYRSKETNRCRKKVSTASSLVPCRPGQYRSPETNRCRSALTASMTLKPCALGQERNPLTNRCRKTGPAGSTLKPCQPGQERNSKTNRCRNVAAKTPPAADFAVGAMREPTSVFLGWWILGGVGILAVSYAGWEWRYEIGRLIRRLRHSDTTGQQ